MTFRTKSCFFLFLMLLGSMGSYAQTVHKTDVLIIGGGASGTTAGIQAARLGAAVTILEETGWLGGMLTSAGVSAIDGNHQLPGGLWGEFREKLYQHYGGPAAVETGWVSNTLFEPHVGDSILKQMAAAEKELQVWFHTRFTSLKKENKNWIVNAVRNKKTYVIHATIVIDATELGDVLAAAGAGYRIGMDSRDSTGEVFAPEKSNDIIQDLTYVAVLKDYGKNANKIIARPAGYDPSVFNCSCDVSDPASFDSPQNNCFRMMQYGRLPNNKYMINWPKCGNDIYLNMIDSSADARERVQQQAKLHTLRFVYYLQTALGYKNLGLADDEFTTPDKLPMIPYHRESRRLRGVVTFTLNHLSNPYGTKQALYRTGIAVGDYTIDHHHLKNPAAPRIDFVKIKVPSYNVPMGSLIPDGVDGLIVAEKSISVSNIVNGATRLQPVVLQIGQAAGAMAAVCIRNGQQPAQLSIREVQQVLLDAKGYIMPFIDVPASDPQYAVIQQLGATGILKGTGVPYMWANQTWFYPEQPLSSYELVQGLRLYYPALDRYWAASGDMLTAESFVKILQETGVTVSEEQVGKDLSAANVSTGKQLSRRAVAVLLDKYLHPFTRRVALDGSLL